MKRMLFVCVLAAAAIPAFAQVKTDAPKTGGASVEQSLQQMERDWAKAGQTKDAATMDRIMADDWAGIDYEGKTWTKAMELADLKSANSSLTSIELGDMKVRVFGNTAVVTGSDTEKSASQGKDTSGKYVWTDVFANRNGKWQAVASQSTKVGK